MSESKTMPTDKDVNVFVEFNEETGAWHWYTGDLQYRTGKKILSKKKG